MTEPILVENYRCCQCDQALVSSPPMDENSTVILCDRCKELIGKLVDRIEHEFGQRLRNKFKDKDDGWDTYQQFILGIIRKRGYVEIVPDNDEFVAEVTRIAQATLATQLGTSEEAIQNAVIKDLVREVVWEEMKKKLHKHATHAQKDHRKKKSRKKRRPMLSLSQPQGNGRITDDEVLRLIDTIAEQPVDAPEDEIVEQFRQAYGSLTLRERLVLYLSSGLSFDKKWTYKQIGDVLQLTPDRIKQLKQRAIEKLKPPSLATSAEANNEHE